MKACPVQPCGTRIADHFVACGFHWSLGPESFRREFRTAARSRDRRRAMVWAVRVLAGAWVFFDELGTNMPPEHQADWAKCRCPACTSAVNRARRAMGIEDDLWARLTERQAA